MALFEKGTRSGPDRWYYNATLCNPSSGDTPDVLARYTETRTVPLLDDCSNYYVALARMSVVGSLNYLPVLRPPVDVAASIASAGSVVTQYKVGLRYTLYAVAAPTVPIAYTDIIVRPVVLPSNYPTSSPTSEDSKYYWVDTAQQVVNGINRALIACASNTANVPLTWVPPAPPVGPTTGINGVQISGLFSLYSMPSPVYTTFDKASYRLHLHSACNPLATPVPNPNPPDKSTLYNCTVSINNILAQYLCRVNVMFNDKLLELMPMEVYSAVQTTLATYVYPTYAWQTAPQQSGTDVMYPLCLESITADDYVPSTAASTSYNPGNVAEYVHEQEYDSTSNWSVFTGMAITSNIIPAYEEAFGNNSIGPDGTSPNANTNTSNIIFDLDLTQDQIHQIQTGIAFVPPVFRWAKLKNAPLNGIDFSIFLRTKDGRFVPWYMTNGGTVSMKLVFSTAPY